MKKYLKKFRTRKIEFAFFLLLLITGQQGLKAQDLPGKNKFTLGAHLTTNANGAVQNSYKDIGFKAVWWRAEKSTKTFLSNFNSVMAWNNDSTKGINYYARAYYSKWPSKENQTDKWVLGVMHSCGDTATWQNTQCWSSVGVPVPRDSLVYGPNYYQEKKYSGIFVPSYPRYVARYRMAFNRIPSADTAAPVCRIKVVLRYQYTTGGNSYYTDTLLQSKNLIVSDFPEDGSFGYFKFDAPYQYPSMISGITASRGSENNKHTHGDTTYSDRVSGTGIQFCVDWLGNDSLGTLYVDYTEVYDQAAWGRYMNPLTRDIVIDSIQAYVNSYSSWNNIKYWYVHDEPSTIDAYATMHIVDSLVHADSDAPLITEFYQTFKIQNGDSLFKYFNRIAKPQILMFDDYPFYWPGNEVKSQEFERLRSELQRVYNYKPGFFYVAQSYGYIKNFPNHWRRPDTSELKAEVMLALSHGAKGIFFWTYDVSSNDDLRNAIVDANGNHSELWNVIHNNLVPRLYGNLGNTLMDLNYTGDYIERKYNAAAKELFPSPQNYDYLTLGLHAAAHEMHWHTGFLVNKNYPDDKYFLLANLNTENNESITVKVTPPVTGYTNYRFRNIEDGYFDTTFSTQITKTLTHSAGEGYLYEVAPVVEYGGKLIYNETITNSKSLQNKMTIENGATLTINGTFDCYDDIILKSGAAISTTNNQRDENGPKIIMHHGHKIIIEANATVNLNVIILYR